MIETVLSWVLSDYVEVERTVVKQLLRGREEDVISEG
jgi:hypothetical protein